MTFKSEIEHIQKLQRHYTRRAEAKEVRKRLELLGQLKKLLNENEALWLDALYKDLGKPAIEAYASEIGLLLNEIDYMTEHLSAWMKVAVNRRYLLSGIEKTTIYREPYGSVLVLAPWNYPLQLSLSPVIGAIAAGNSVVLKPSESAPAVSHLLAKLVPQYFAAEVFYVVEGDGDTAQALTDLKWDFVFFTGGPAVAQDVYQKAAKHLTPVVLELGGKNPCIVDKTGFNENSLKKIVWGKFLNAGQTCIAPDTIYVQEEIYDSFLKAARKQIVDFYGDNPIESDDYARIVHDKHLNKMNDFLKEGEIYYGGNSDEGARYLSPTLLTNIKKDSALDREEIFGPLLPIVPYRKIEEITGRYQKMPVPLVAYLFSEDKETIDYVREHMESGALSINETLVHASSPQVPFGGKGQSGMGNYHGKASFETFTYPRTVYEKKTLVDLPQQFPPYADEALGALRRLRRKIY